MRDKTDLEKPPLFFRETAHETLQPVLGARAVNFDMPLSPGGYQKSRALPSKTGATLNFSLCQNEGWGVITRFEPFRCVLTVILRALCVRSQHSEHIKIIGKYLSRARYRNRHAFSRVTRQNAVAGKKWNTFGRLEAGRKFLSHQIPTKTLLSQIY